MAAVPENHGELRPLLERPEGERAMRRPTRREPGFPLVAAALAALIGLSCGTREAPDGPVKAMARKGVSNATAADLERVETRRTVYVPVYPYVYTEGAARPYHLAATLYVRNTDPTAPLFVTSVRLHDAGGQRVRDYVTDPLRLDPLAAAEFFVKEGDTAGGSSASFLVGWAAGASINPPVVETVMVGTLSNQGVAFTAPGRTIESPPR
jgi:hypothetical protein